ncbi:hypothetical protein AD942_01000, partial [Gluconobacter japonicus]
SRASASLSLTPRSMMYSNVIRREFDARFAVALWEKGPQTIHLFIRQPKQVAHLQPPRRA